jgi:hypothetical protein
MNVASMLVDPSIYNSIPFDSLKDVTLIILVWRQHDGAGGESVGAGKSTAELIKLAAP